MKTIDKISLAILLLLSIANVQPESTEITICLNERTECLHSQFGERIQCINNNRVKRQSCEDNNIQCNANNCDVSTILKPMVDPCYESCQNSCTGNTCHDRCEQSCQIPYIKIVNPIPQNDPLPPILDDTLRLMDISIPQQPLSQVQMPRSPNITTIIKLTNVVNNTNVVNVPTTINNTNINNIELDSNTTGSLLNNKKKDEECCLVVQPKVCQHHKNEENITVMRCIHRKHHTCGEVCASQTVHAQVRQPCNGPSSTCPPSVAYVPQPNPRCVYQQNWPYVNCDNRENPTCEGCYDHYGYGFERYHGNAQPDCTGCYDDGYNLGAMYRQGPVYRPGYYHAPPNYLTGNFIQQPILQQPFLQQPFLQEPFLQEPFLQQHFLQQNCGILGCFGNELIDPVFGMQSFSPYPTSVMDASQYYQNPQFSIQPPTNYYPQIPYPGYQPPIVNRNMTVEFIVQNGTSDFMNDYLKMNSSGVVYPYPTPQYNPFMTGYPPIPVPYHVYPRMGLPFFQFPVNETVLITKKK